MKLLHLFHYLVWIINIVSFILLSYCCDDCGRRKNGDPNPVCCIITLLIVGLIITLVFLKGCAPDPEYKIISTQQEFHLLGPNGNTVLENTKTKERKTVNGILGKEGDVIKYNP